MTKSNDSTRKKLLKAGASLVAKSERKDIIARVNVAQALITKHETNAISLERFEHFKANMPFAVNYGFDDKAVVFNDQLCGERYAMLGLKGFIPIFNDRPAMSMKRCRLLEKDIEEIWLLRG